MLIKNALIMALIATLPSIAQDAPQSTIPARQPHHWGVRGEMPRRGERPDMHARMLEKFDADKDGQLSEQEKAAMKAELEQRRAAFRKNLEQKFDTDGDGKLSEEEQATMRKEMKKRRDMRRPHHRQPR